MMTIQAKIRSFLAKPGYRKWIFTIFKWLILALLAWAIYHQVVQRKDLADILSGFQRHFHWERSGWLMLSVLLMPLNWGLEAVKWRYLLRPDVELSFGRALRSILAGISVSLFTPNRIGEYGGRLLLIPADKSWRGLSATFVGSMAQWIVLLLAGGWGLSVVGAGLWPEAAGFYRTYRYGLWGIGLLLPILYMHFGRIAGRILAWNWLNTIKGYRQIKLQSGLESYKSDKLSRVLFLALSRYLIYSTQYLLLLYGFGFGLDPLLGMAGIASIFLVQSSVPLPPFLALVARGELAILLWSAYGVNELVVLISTFSLFIINLVVPALLGGATIVKIKL